VTETQAKITSTVRTIGAGLARDTYQLPIWLGALAAAEVGKRPSRVPLHAKLVILAQKGQKGPQGTLLENVIPANWTVTSDITQSPNSLFTDIENGGREQPDKLWDGVGVDNHLGMVSGSGGNVRQGPRGFKLEMTRE